MAVAHTYGPSCLLHADYNKFIRRASSANPGAPPLRVQFFYCSILPIDDPLTPIPTPSSGGRSKTTKLPPRPFAIHDNAALDAAWLDLQERLQKKAIADVAAKRRSSRSVPRSVRNTRNSSRNFARSSEFGEQPKTPRPKTENAATQEDDPDVAVGTAIASKSYESYEFSKPDLTLSDDPRLIPFDEGLPLEAAEASQDQGGKGLRRRSSIRTFRQKDKLDQPKTPEPESPQKSLSSSVQKSPGLGPGSSPRERDTSGTPFLRIPSRLKRSLSRPRFQSNSLDSQTAIVQTDGASSQPRDIPPSSQSSRPGLVRSQTSRSDSTYDSNRQGRPKTRSEQKFKSTLEAEITVGYSRLHIVVLPSLKMGPIYWDPIHDISSVVRGTWFYKDTMWPVETEIANRIEQGFQFIKPWTQAYVDELSICQEIGPEAELKLVHRMWAAEDPRPSTSQSKSWSGKEMEKPLKDTHRTEQSPTRELQLRTRAAGVLDGFDAPARLFRKCSLIYADEKEAQILKPNQLPSITRGRRPLAAIRRGKAVGIPVIRGFDQRAWEKLYPPSRKIVITQKAQAAAAAVGAEDAFSQRLPPCEACLRPDERPRPTDLVFVIHGIGQKLSEKVESYHFTHAINAFRRQVNVEFEDALVKPWLRQEFGAAMILPINWRSKIEVDDEGSGFRADHEDMALAKNQYTLKDITVDSIPAIRNLMSDVLLDIPLYLSHHKSKMIEAVISEANRVYRLWCLNNLGFENTGRVHIMAHSLGSVMTLDILSNQPTTFDESLVLKDSEPRSDMFEFDTKNVFFLGSPAGLFLYLNHVPLLPRRDRNKPGSDGDDYSSKVAGEAGTYGCLAVDNLYNVLHYIDPIAYHLNACVDVKYSTSLQRAYVPSTAISWAQYFGLAKKTQLVPNKVLAGLENFPVRPPTHSMPSAVELETHNFSQEEIAERRMFLLNDNGQIDFTLRSAGGPLEVQYLSMLSAHSSYWTMQDFVRFLVVEIGRKPGRSETVASMKAVKKMRGRKVGMDS